MSDFFILFLPLFQLKNLRKFVKKFVSLKFMHIGVKNKNLNKQFASHKKLLFISFQIDWLLHTEPAYKGNYRISHSFKSIFHSLASFIVLYKMCVGFSSQLIHFHSFLNASSTLAVEMRARKMNVANWLYAFAKYSAKVSVTSTLTFPSAYTFVAYICVWLWWVLEPAVWHFMNSTMTL